MFTKKYCSNVPYLAIGTSSARLSRRRHFSFSCIGRRLFWRRCLEKSGLAVFDSAIYQVCRLRLK